MGYTLGTVKFQHGNGHVALEARGLGIEFTLTWLMEDGRDKIDRREVFKLRDEQCLEMMELMELGLNMAVDTETGAKTSSSRQILERIVLALGGFEESGEDAVELAKRVMAQLATYEDK